MSQSQIVRYFLLSLLKNSYQPQLRVPILNHFAPSSVATYLPKVKDSTSRNPEKCPGPQELQEAQGFGSLAGNRKGHQLLEDEPEQETGVGSGVGCKAAGETVGGQS